MSIGEATLSRAWLRSLLRALLYATGIELALFLLLVVVHAASPGPAILSAADATGLALAITAVVTLAVCTAFGLVAYPSLRVPILFLAILTGATIAAHLYIINNPKLPDCRDTTKDVNGCIMDEVYYVPTAENMLAGGQCGSGVPSCNPEHPFLSKAFIAAGIAIFGDNQFGWRIFNVLFGAFSLPLLFFLVYRISGDRRPAYFASVLLGLDVMFFTQSSAALIDVPAVFFAMLAFVAYAYDARYWFFDRYIISGVFLGLSVLSKETSIFLVLTLATYHALTHRESPPSEGRLQRLVLRIEKSLNLLVAGRVVGIAMIAALCGLAVIMTGAAPGLSTSSTAYGVLEVLALGFGVPFFLIEAALFLQERPAVRPAVSASLKIILVAAAVFVLGLQAYDSLFARGYYLTFVDQLKYMLSYGSSLVGPGWSYDGIQITPFSWMTFYKPVTYYGTSISVCTDLVNNVCQSPEITYPGVAYYGVTNLIETWTTYLWFPLAAIIAWKAFGPVRRGLERFGFVAPSGRTLTGDEKLAVFSLAWFSWNYFPYVLLFAVGRVTYPFYIIPALPAIAIGAAYFLTRKWVPWPATALYFAGAFLLFFVFFPSKGFLPEWLRALIGR